MTQAQTIQGKGILYLAVGAAGAVGALLRYVIGEWTATYTYYSFPLGTAICNLLGCLILGWLSVYMSARKINTMLRAAVSIGLIGSFTTFSAFSTEMVNMMNAEQWIIAFTYFWISLLGGWLFAWAGYRTAIRRLAARFHLRKE